MGPTTLALLSPLAAAENPLKIACSLLADATGTGENQLRSCSWGNLSSVGAACQARRWVGLVRARTLLWEGCGGQTELRLEGGWGRPRTAPHRLPHC